MQLCVGMVFKGYCNGMFEYETYFPKRLEAWGADWLVVREESGRVNFCRFTDIEERDRKVEEWLKDPGHE